MSDDPYASPTTVATNPVPDGPSVDGRPAASQNKRLGNFLIDTVATYVMSFFVGVVIGIVYLAGNGGQQLTQQDEISMQLTASVVGFVFTLLYFFFMELLFGATVGKFLTGTRVVSARGGKASFGQLLGRTFARMIPFEPFSFLFGDKTTGWHDSLSSTRVVDMRAK